MFSIANLLERAKANANIESDYRLAKVLRIKQSAISNYRAGRLPNVEILEALCALSGDDAGLIVAQVEAERAADGPVKAMWLGVAKRLAGGASTAILSVVFTIALIAGYAEPARAGGLFASKAANSAVCTSYQVRFCQFCFFWLDRLRRYTVFLRLCILAAC